MPKYCVSGGVYTDTGFKVVKADTYERHGPFDTYQEAYDVWKARMWLNVDNALHRLTIIEEIEE